MINRRQLIASVAAAAGATALPHQRALAQNPFRQTVAGSGPPSRNGRRPAWMREPHPEPGEPGKHYQPTVTLN
ncbi:MAG TPA: copper oxidase, partial [Chthoniobacteraceae bacterium]|nr:copper oxidase [Chthoniobacteraceae bacterium]